MDRLCLYIYHIVCKYGQHYIQYHIVHTLCNHYSSLYHSSN